MEYFLGYHLGSTSITTDTAGANVSEMRYKAFGEVMYATAGQTLPTRYMFTGQYSYVSDEATDTAGFGLLYFNARWVDPALGRFAQADTIIPGAGNSQAWDRYSYSLNNPVRYADPSGHCPICGAAIGATIGAKTTAVLYTVNNRQSFDVAEYQTAVVAGAIAGGLIGSGIGILAASGTIAAEVATASSLIGAGTSASMTETTYILGNPDEFDARSFALQSGTAAVAGAVTSNPGAGLGVKATANVIAAETSYFTTGNEHSLQGALATGVLAGGATALQFAGDSWAEDHLLINRPIQGDLSMISSASMTVASQNIRTATYGAASGILTGGAIIGGQSLAQKLRRLDQ